MSADPIIDESIIKQFYCAYNTFSIKFGLTEALKNYAETVFKRIYNMVIFLLFRCSELGIIVCADLNLIGGYYEKRKMP